MPCHGGIGYNDDRSHERQRMTLTSDAQAPNGARILVVEDELMIRMLLEDMLSELGYTIAAQAGRVDEALAAANSGDFQVAILDVNLNGQTIAPVADALAARGVPFVFATGYGESGLPESHRDRPTLKKPFQMDGLGRTLLHAMNGHNKADPAPIET